MRLWIGLLFLSLTVQAEENRLRHLVEQWPYERIKESQASPVVENSGYLNIVLDSKKEDYGLRLKTLADKAIQSRQKCGASLSLAVASLRDRWFEGMQQKYFCASDNCVEALDAVDLLESQLNELENGVEECSESSLRLWFNSNETDLDVELGLAAVQTQNPKWSQSAEDAYWALIPGAKVLGSYRAQSTWHRVDIQTNFWAQSDLGNDFQFSVLQEHGYSFLGGTEWKLSSVYEQSSDWLYGPFSPFRNDFSIFALQLDGRFTLLGEEEERLIVAYGTDSWDNGLWDNTDWSIRLQSYFQAPLATTSFLEFRVRREMDSSAVGMPDMWAFGLLYSIRAQVSSQSQVLIDLGLEDIRVANESARLWPILSITAEGRVLGYTGLSAGASMYLLPENNLWSRASLKMGTSLSTSYATKKLKAPLEFSLYKYMHRAGLGGRRDDLFLGVSFAPEYSLNSKNKLSVSYEIEHLWAGVGVAALPFPTGGTTYDLGLEWTYAF